MSTTPAFKTGLIGASIQASRSPAMHTQEAQALGLSLTYELFDLDRLGGPGALPGILERVEGAGYTGVNITHPCKQRVMAHLHAVSEDAQRLGAVNTVLFEAGRRVGYNTDWVGFAEGLRRSLPDAPLRQVMQIGAGGAGAATSYALLRRGAERLQIYDLEGERATQLSERLNAQFGPGRTVPVKDLTGIAHCDGLVNASPIGMHGHPGLPVPAALLRPSLWVAEVVYFPLETALLRAARALGCQTVDGGDMAVLQAAAAFELFTGHRPDKSRMLQRFRAAAT